MKEDTPSKERRQDETRRIGHEAATKEAVKPVVENKDVHDAARQARFAATGEPSQACSYDEA